MDDDTCSMMDTCTACGKEVPSMNMGIHKLHACRGARDNRQPSPSNRHSTTNNSNIVVHTTDDSVELIEPGTPPRAAPSDEDDDEEEEDRKMPAIDLSGDSPMQQQQQQEQEVIDLFHDDDEEEEDEIQVLPPTNNEHHWTCPRCTLHNRLSNDVCSACHYAHRTRLRRRHHQNDNADTVRPPDPVRRERLIGGPTGSPQLDNDSSFQLMSSGALLGGMLGATGGLVLGDDTSLFGNRVMQGALGGAVGGAVLSNFLSPSPPRASRRTTSNNPYATRRMQRYSHNDLAMDAFLQSLRQPRLNLDRMSHEELLSHFGDGTENMGASASTIHSLPVTTIHNPDSLPEDARQCGICLEPFCQGEEKRTLPCWHGYHKHCVDQWLRQNGSCPICKTKV